MKKRTIKICALLVLLTLLFSFSTSCIFRKAGSERILTKDELSENVSRETDTGIEFVWEYLDKWDFPVFDAGKLKRVEKIFRDYYYTDIPSSYELARAVADDFINNRYDTIDFSDTVKVSDVIITAYVRAIGDAYSFYRTNEQYDTYTDNLSGSFVGIGVSITPSVVDGGIPVIEPLRNSPAEKAGVLAGDSIVKIDGESVQSLGYDESVNRIKGKRGTKVKITVRRGEEEIELTIVREPITELTVDYYIDESGIGYIDINSFKLNTDDLFIEAIDYMKENGAVAVVYDVRDNGGGYLDTVLNMIDYIAPDGITLASFSNDYEDPDVSNDDHSYFVPTVIVCNGNSASASELFTSAIRDIGNMGYFDVVIVGSVTYGKGVMQNSYTLSDGSAVTLTVAKYYPPSKEDYNGIGIMPNVTVENASKVLIKAFETAEELIAN